MNKQAQIIVADDLTTLDSIETTEIKYRPQLTAC